jgi:hypothetical protein
LEENLNFMKPGAFRGELWPNDVERMIRKLRCFLGDSALVVATKDFHSRSKIGSGVFAMRLSHRQPLIEAFEQFDRITFKGRRPLKSITPELLELANLAGIGAMVIPTLSSAVADHHREMLLSRNGNFWSQRLEWLAAGDAIRRHQAHIAWTEPGQAGPEFVARVGEVMFDVECKYQSTMVTQYLGDNEADYLASEILQLVQKKCLRGRLTLSLSAEQARGAQGLIPFLLEVLNADLAAGKIDVSLPGGVRLSGRLFENDNFRLGLDEWSEQVESTHDSSTRVFGSGLRDGSYVVDPLTLDIAAPLKSAEDLHAGLWKMKFDKAARQCTGKRGAVLVMEWEDVDDPTLFQQHPLFQQLMADTFKNYSYVTRINMRCDTPPQHRISSYSMGVHGYTAVSNAPAFPETVPMLALDSPMVE